MVKLLVVCVISLCPVLASAAGSTAMPFLKIDSGARAAALGGAYSAAGDDAASIFYNPAGAALADTNELEISHTEWLQGLRNENLVYVHPLSRNYTVFGGANVLLSGDMDKNDASGVNIGSFNSQEGAFSFGLSAALGGDWYNAYALKVFYQKADRNRASSLGGDAGLLKIAGDWRFGVSVSNVGAKLKLGSSAFDLPLMIRAGAARRLKDQLLVSLDALKAGENAVALCAGVENGFDIGEEDLFFVRVGYKSGRSQYAGSGFTGGIGIKYNDLGLDYAFSPYGELGDAHRITLSFNFGEPREEFTVKTVSSPEYNKKPRKTPAARKTYPRKKKVKARKTKGFIFPPN
ncbi:MAG TPA: hypothetical protein DCL44_03780 [Elusimicrobia bacterium]|nr:hypothetical protein [Elusimicrobiota bacterium]